jgi:hypothetical protein
MPKLSNIAAFLILLWTSSCSTSSDGQWKTVNEGFEMSVPSNWRKVNVQGIDSHVATYRARTVQLEFDEVFGLGYTLEKSQLEIEDLKKKEADPRLLKPGEEVWHVGGKTALFLVGKVNPEDDERHFVNDAELFVPYSGLPGYLAIYVYYKSDRDVPTVRRVLQSLDWKKMDAAVEARKARAK